MSSGWILIGVIVVIALFVFGAYNRLVALAQRVSQRIVCLQEGRVTLEGDSRSLTRDHIKNAYLWLGASGAPALH